MNKRKNERRKIWKIDFSLIPGPDILRQWNGLTKTECLHRALRLCTAILHENKKRSPTLAFFSITGRPEKRPWDRKTVIRLRHPKGKLGHFEHVKDPKECFMIDNRRRLSRVLHHPHQ